MTDPKTPSSSAIGHSSSAINASTGVENAAAEDLDCLQAALADSERERAALLQRSHATETNVQGKLQHAELRFRRAVDQLEANQRSAYAVRVRLEADLQAARSRAQRAQEALAASQEASERLRMANAELSTAMEAAQWRLSELEAENATHCDSLRRMEEDRHADGQRLADLEDALLAQRQVAAEETAAAAELTATVGDLQARAAAREETIHQLQAERVQLAAALSDLGRQRVDDQREYDSLQQRSHEIDAERAALREREADLQSQLVALRSAQNAADAARDIVHADELRVWHDTTVHQQAALTAAYEERATLVARVAELDADNQADRERHQTLCEQLHSLEETLRERDTIIARLQGIEGELKHALTTHADERHRWQQHTDQLTSDREALACRTQLLEDELQQLRLEVVQLRAGHAQTLRDADEAARRIVDESNAAAQALRDEIDALRCALTDAGAAKVVAQEHSRDIEALLEERTGQLAALHRDAGEAIALAQQNAETRVEAEQRAAELIAQRTELMQQLEDLQTQSALAQHRHQVMATQIAELEGDRATISLQVDELKALSRQLERECDRLRRDRGSSEETRRLKADSTRLEAKIIELDRQRTEAVQRHSAAVAGYMVELNQRSEALHAREVELQKLAEELALVKQSYENAVGEFGAERRQREALERDLEELRATPTRTAVPSAAEPGRATAPTPLRPTAPSAAPRVSAAKSARRPSPSDAITGPVTVVHLDENKALCEVAHEVVARVPDAVYVNALDTTAANGPGSRLLAVNFLSRTHDAVEAITAFIAADKYHGNVLAYCAEGSNGFLFGMADFFPHPVDPDACLARLLESRGAIQRLLVVTENFTVVGALRDVLSRMRSSVSAALDLRQVFDLLPMVEPDIILVDLGLPRGEGLRLVSRLRSDPKTKDMPLGILLAPAGNAAEFRQHALRAARDLPMAAADLAAALHQRLGARAPVTAPARPLQSASALA